MTSATPQNILLNGTKLTLTKSDGDANMLPEAEKREVDREGNVDYLAEADDETVNNWLMKTGSYLVYMGDWYKPPRLQRFALEKFPKDYKLYIHYKGKKSDPRKDAYLHGSSHVNKFRSPEEFVPHAEWLALGCPMTNGSPKCGCRYCSEVKQGIISKHLKKCVGDLFSNSFALEPSEARPLHGPLRTRRTPPARNVGPIRAKDYTKLNETGEIKTWVENQSD